MHKVYLFEQPEQVTEEFVEHALLLLPPERQKKAMRYRQAIDRKNCVVTYIMLKMALNECFHITDFTLGYGVHGKPYLVEYPSVHFSISHCKCACAVAVSDCPIGVDVQDIRPFSWEVAERVCTGAELEYLRRSKNRDEDFTRLWVRKESYGKMLGVGIKR